MREFYFHRKRLKLDTRRLVMAKQDRHWQVPPFHGFATGTYGLDTRYQQRSRDVDEGQNAYRNIQANLALIAGQQPITKSDHRYERQTEVQHP